MNKDSMEENQETLAAQGPKSAKEFATEFPSLKMLWHILVFSHEGSFLYIWYQQFSESKGQ